MDMNEEYGLTPYETREILFYKTDNGEVRVEILLYPVSYTHLTLPTNSLV